MGAEESFLGTLQTDPRDDVTRSVYADWLEDRGDNDRAEFLRLQLAAKALLSEQPARSKAQERLSELRYRLDAGWLSAVDSLARLGELSRSARRVANRLGVSTVCELCERSEEEGLGWCFSETVLSELRGKLAQHGLRLGGGYG
jgi:uncharacterized protein (TIGR02996 family)